MVANYFTILYWFCHTSTWLQSPSAVIMEPKKIKSVTASTFPPYIYHEVIGLDAMIFSSVQFSSVIESCLTLCEHARLPRPSPAPGACSNSCPSSQSCHPTSSASDIPFSCCLQSFPASGSFPMSQFFTSGSQSIGPSASASILPMNNQDWLPLGLTVLISLQFPRDSQESSPAPQFKGSSSSTHSLLYGPTLTSIHDYWKNHSFDYTDLCQQSDVFAF